jgi:uracil-DNA glycosylase family 4
MTGARLASGPPSARIVVVVDSARKWDVIKEGLLVGPAGSRFEEWLQAVGLRRQDVYITTLVTERVTKDNLRTKPKAEVEYAVELLHQRLAALQDPWVIVPMDEVALTALTGKRKLSKWRGSILQYTDSRGRAIKVIPTLHPQETFRAPTLERWCRYDWARIAGDSTFRELRLPERALHIRPTLRDVQAFVRDLSVFEAVSLDIETPRQIVLREKVLKSGKTKVSKAYGPSRITCIAFAPAANWAICVPTTLDYWGNKADLALVWQHVRDICGHRVPKVLQNGLFDRYHLKRERDIDVVNHLWDTLCLSHAYDSASKHSLAKLASVWTREPYWKDDAKDLDDDDGECDFEDVKSIDDFWRYCAKDSAVTYEIKDRIVPVLEADGLLAKYHQHYPPLFDPLLKMMLDGVRQDPHTKAAHLQQLEVDLRAHRADLDAETTANVRYKDGTPYGKSIIATKAISNKLLQEVLYDVLRLPRREKTRKDTGEKTTTADSVALRSLALRHKATCGRLVELILAYRRTGKIKDFIKEGVADADHRVRCQYKFTTETHRLASSRNPGRTGQNLQNVDRSVRRHYLSDPGTVFIELDASQAEDRIVKVQGYLLTGNKDLLWRARAQPWENDEHKRAAAAIFNVPVDHVTKQQRTLGKTSRHACHDDQTEVLTETGWMSFPEYVKRPVPIAEWQADDNTIAFKAPSQVHQYDFDGELHTFDAKGFSQHVTGNHRMRYHRPSANRDHVVVAEAATLTDKTRLRFQTAGFYTGTQRLDPAFARLLVATQADGCIRDRTRISFRFKRRRKIERLRTLLASLNIDGHERCTADGVTQFTLCKNDALPVLAWLGPEKVYGAWLLQLDAATLDCMLAELVHWDGHQAKTSLIYWSVKRVNVDWIQTIAHLRGVRSLIRACHGCWRLYLSPVRLTSVKQVGTKTYAGKVYCVTTSTGYFMVRKNTYISISCNSNYGMGGKTHSENLLKQGVVITPDEAQTMIDAIMAADPEIAEWQRATRIAVMRDRAITNVWGWSLSFKYDRLDDAVYRRAYAYRPQSDCGIMTNINGIVPFWAWLHEQRRRTRSVAWAMTRLALQVHDAIIVCCPPETAYDVAAFIKQHLETPLPYDGGKCPLVIPATLKIGTSWEMAKEYTRFPGREELEAECRRLLVGQQALLATAPAVG